ncbi:MAG: competence protein ComK [Bacilli bacterium]
MNYIINKNTNYLVEEDYKTKISEKNNFIIVNTSLLKIIDESCNYFGSSYKGRVSGTKYLIEVTSKPPIIINESSLLVIFPLFSPRRNDSLWVNYNNVLTYRKITAKSIEVIFKNYEKVKFNVSYNIFNNQIYKCSRLLSIYTLRK